jgi:hypothetical protein
MRTPALGQRRAQQVSFQYWYWRRTSSRPVVDPALSAVAGGIAVGRRRPPKSSWWRTAAARISKNSSRLVQEMHR